MRVRVFECSRLWLVSFSCQSRRYDIILLVFVLHLPVSLSYPILDEASVFSEVCSSTLSVFGHLSRCGTH